MMFHLSVYGVLIISMLYKSCDSAGGTTQGIKEVFIGRCWQYQSISEFNKIDALKVNINCTDLWGSFEEAVANKNPCDVTSKDYQRFFQLLNTTKKINNALFWSGLHDLVTDFTFINDDYIVLEDTMTGYLLNNLQWCGSSTSTDGFNYTHCNTGATCNVMTPAWTLASSKFAELASGTTQVLLNATRANSKDAFAIGSFFRTVELPKLRVNKLIVFLASSIGKDVREKCDDSVSMQNIRAEADRNIEVECIDQPRLVLGVYCLKYPKGKECIASGKIHGNENSAADETRAWKVVGILFSILFMAVCIGLVVYILRMRKLEKTYISRTSTNGLTQTEPNANTIWI